MYHSFFNCSKPFLMCMMCMTNTPPTRDRPFAALLPLGVVAHEVLPTGGAKSTEAAQIQRLSNWHKNHPYNSVNVGIIIPIIWPIETVFGFHPNNLGVIIPTSPKRKSIWTFLQKPATGLDPFPALSLSLSHSCWLPHCFLGRYFAWIWVEFQWHFPKQGRSPLRNPDFTSGATGCSSWDHLTPLHLKSALQPRSIKILRFFTYQDEPEKRSVSSCLMQGKKSPRSIKIPRFSVASPRSRLPKSRGFRLALTQVLESGVNGTAKGDRKVIVVIFIGGHITNCIYIYIYVC